MLCIRICAEMKLEGSSTQVHCPSAFEVVDMLQPESLMMQHLLP